MLGGCKAAPAPQAQRPETDAACASVPKIAVARRVTDSAGVLSDADESRLSAQLEGYERKTHHQMVVLTTNLDGIPIKTFATCTGNRWGIGRKDEDDGILILVAPSERQVRIATGPGMEKLLTDAKTAGVIAETAPYFRKGDYAGAIDMAVTAIAAETGAGQ
ncbi:YgcG family protein [Sphingopyxis sp. GW247-27LB]|uniref:TPM domain-containing protein n=1 Tax=Sphingopyxis sp. GW247-27LB TaxID=2012632 RepID=UPI000BA5C4F3|nr:TPM domain-containing protein [Sphingopyxis sp. GW247-27LB]